MPTVPHRSTDSPRPRPGRSALPRVLMFLLAACGAAPTVAAADGTGPGTGTIIFVTSNGWHSGIVLARADIPPPRLPEAADFPEARFLEFGWGDADYYRASDPGIGMALRAALVPTPAVLHVAGLWAEPARVFPGAEIVALPVDGAGFRRLVDFIDASVGRAGAARADATGPGLTASSRFYPATGRFHAFNTCNSWTARALAAAGFEIAADGAPSADQLMRQVRALVDP